MKTKNISFCLRIPELPLHTKEISLSFLVTFIFPLCYFLYRQWFIIPSKKEKAVKFSLSTPIEAAPHWKGKHLDPISLRNAADPNTIQCYCPATGQFLGNVPSAQKEDIDNAIFQSSKAQQKWKLTSFSERRRVLNTLGQYIVDHQDEIARVACRDSGKTMVDASMGEILVTLEKINWILKHGEKALKPSKRPGPSNILMSYKGAEVRYEPMGVVAALVSWNYPFHNLMGPVIAAIFTGNGIVVKCSESVVWSSLHFIQIVKRALKVCGHDPELVQVISIWPEDADYLTSHPDISHITFIGSKPVAHKVLTAASKSLTPVVVELGGKDAFVVLDDANNIPGIASIILRGTYQSSGQNCIGIERVVALPKVYDQLVEIFEKRVPEIRLGSAIDQQEDVDMGASITDIRFKDLEEQIYNAVKQGARLVYGGKRYIHPKYTQGHYFTPTVLVDVTPDMDIAKNEVFGPVLTIMKAETIEEAVDIANGTIFGLGGSVFGTNQKDLQYVTNNMSTGNVAINDFATFYVCQLPFGGVRGSGYGKFGGEEGLQGLCYAKSVCYDKYPFISTAIPKPLDYPIPNVKKAWEFVKALNVAGYHTSVWKRIKAVGVLAKNS